MLKKLALLLTLLFCLSLPVDQANAQDSPEPDAPTVQVEGSDPENPGGPDDEGIMLIWEDPPIKDEEHPNTGASS